MDGEQTARQIAALARQLSLPPDACRWVGKCAQPEFLIRWAAVCRRLTEPDQAQQAWQELDAALSPRDGDGMQLLTLYLAAACRTRRRFREAEIPDVVFWATLGCLPRFLQETRRRQGRLCFDRGFWCWRQLSGRLFRLGTLEFEYRLTGVGEPLPTSVGQGVPVLSVHIPSDAGLTDLALQDAYRQASEFFARHRAALCLQGAPQAMLCSSWLLAPALSSLLPESSGIRRFGRGYRVYAADLADDGYCTWLFDGQTDPAHWPRRTRLQRAAAEFLTNGGRIGCGFGIRDPLETGRL